MNFLKETKDAIHYSEHNVSNVIYIGTRDGSCLTWKQFEEMANFEYDAGFGGAEIRDDILVVFSDGSYLERAEYDGSEWWRITIPFVMPETTTLMTDLKYQY